MRYSRIALILVIIGAINWLLVGLFQWDLVSAIFGGGAFRPSALISRIIYLLVGIAGIMLIPALFTREEPVK